MYHNNLIQGHENITNFLGIYQNTRESSNISRIPFVVQKFTSRGVFWSFFET